MMKTRLSLLALFVFGISMPALADADIPLQPQHYNQDHQGEDGGNVIFNGSVYASPCVLAPQSRLQIIEMGEISARRFHQAATGVSRCWFTSNSRLPERRIAGARQHRIKDNG
jgi:type 1 fimbria pilin